MWKILREKELLVKLTISYLLIFVILFVAGLHTYFNVYKTSIESLNQYSQLILTQLPSKISDEIIKPIDLIVETIDRNPFYLTLLSTSHLLIHKDRIILEIRNFCDELRFYYTNPLILEIGIFLPRENIIITPNFFESSELYYHYILRPNNISYFNWHKFLSSSYYKCFFPPSKFFLKSVFRNAILFIHTLSNWNFQNQKANLFILLDEEKIKEFFKSLSFNWKSNFYLINSNKAILLAYTPYKGLEKLVSNLNFELLEKDILVKIRYKGDEWIIFYATDQNLWKYVVILSHKVFFRPIYKIKWYLTLYFLIAGILGPLLIGFFSLKNYQPIREIKEILLSPLKFENIKTFEINSLSFENKTSNKNESSLLKEMVNYLVVEERNLKDQFLQLLPLVQNSLITQLLTGNFDYSVSEKEICEKFHISFVSDLFIVILIEIFDSREFSEGTIYDCGTLRFILKIINEVLISNGNKLFTTIGPRNRLIILLNIGDNQLDISYVAERAEYLKNYLQSNFSIFVTAGLSTIKKGLQSIAQCYEEAEKALNFKFVNGYGKVYKYETISIYEDSAEVSCISFALENKIINSILEANKSELEKILDSIYYTYFIKNEICFTKAKILCIHLYVIYENACKIINFKSSPTLIKYLEKEVINTNIQTCQDFFQKIKKLFIELTEHVKKSKLSFNSSLVEKIKKYIDETYTDPNISLALIAEKFKLSPQYLSKLFKEKTGQNLSDYILELRIEKAKYLLLNTSFSIKEISQQVGYTHVNSFIFAFTREVGMSPLKFRTLFLKKEES